MWSAYRAVMTSGGADGKKKLSLTIRMLSPGLHRLLRG